MKPTLKALTFCAAVSVFVVCSFASVQADEREKREIVRTGNQLVEGLNYPKSKKGFRDMMFDQCLESDMPMVAKGQNRAFCKCVADGASKDISRSDLNDLDDLQIAEGAFDSCAQHLSISDSYEEACLTRADLNNAKRTCGCIQKGLETSARQNKMSLSDFSQSSAYSTVLQQLNASCVKQYE